MHSRSISKSTFRFFILYHIALKIAIGVNSFSEKNKSSEKYKSNGKDALRLVHTVRVRDADGKSVNRKQIVRTFGLLSKYDGGQLDYLQRLRKSFQDGDPLIPELREFVGYSLCSDSTRCLRA